MSVESLERKDIRHRGHRTENRDKGEREYLVI